MTGTHFTDADMERRLKIYKEKNQSTVGDPSISTFFQQYNIPVFIQSGTQPEEELLNAMKIFIEQSGKPKNYMTFEEEAEKARIEREEEDTKKDVDGEKEDVD